MIVPLLPGRSPLARLILLVLFSAFPVAILAEGTAAGAKGRPFVIAVHGGAGAINPAGMKPEEVAAIESALRSALEKGHAILQAGGSSLDAVEAAVTVLEDSPLFNAGKGSVYNADAQVEMDASIMDGQTGLAGAVAGVHHVKNPVRLARQVMEKSPHVLLVGDGAEAFARETGVALETADYFFTGKRWQQLLEIKEKERSKRQPPDRKPESGGEAPAAGSSPGEKKFGTVGAVALDACGHLAAATSTGGMVNKRFGRVGDSPIIGAGCWASDRTCALSATGHGEYFIRGVVAYDIAARMEYLGESLESAADSVVMKKLAARGGEGGVIAVDAQGLVAMRFNTPGMYRGVMGADGKAEVRILP